MTTATSDLAQHVKGRLLPLSPIAKFLERCVEMLPRRMVPVQLMPDREIAVLNQAKGEYNATGYSPAFEIVLTPEMVAGGWFYLEAALVRHTGNREARINGSVKESVPNTFEIFIPANLRGSIREVFYLPKNTSNLHWSPTAAPGVFSQSELLVNKITPVESFLRRVHRVGLHLWQARHVPASARMSLTLSGALHSLQVAYETTARLQIRRYSSDDYQAFIERNETLEVENIGAMRKTLSALAGCPRITLVIFIQSPLIGWFQTTVESVARQIYTNWELLIVGDFSTHTECLAAAEANHRQDARIKVVSTSGIADKTDLFNYSLNIAQGEYIAEVGQHDVLPLHALLYMAHQLSQASNADLIYTDQDEFDAEGKRINPRFKPDWNPDLFTSHNYLDRLCLYRTDLVRKLGGYRHGFEGAEEYDLALRSLQNTQPDRIKHISKVLYHKRSSDHTGALGNKELTVNQAHQSGKRALADYFSGTGETVDDGPSSGLFRVRHPMPKKLPLVTIIIPTRDRLDILRSCIESIQNKTDYPNWELLIVDNESVERETLDYLAALQNIRAIRVIQYNHSFNYSAIHNFALQHANGEVLALLNNDVEVITPGWLGEMVSHAIRPEVGAVGAKLLYANGLVQHAGVVLGIGGVAGHVHKYLDGEHHGYCMRAVVTQNFSAVTGACLVVRKKLYKEVGGLNEDNLKVALNDIDFCLKLREAGYQNLFTPYAQLYHHESISRGHDDTPEKHALFIRETEYMKRTWGALLQQDPAYNPNLTLGLEDFSLNKIMCKYIVAQP